MTGLQRIAGLLEQELRHRMDQSGLMALENDEFKEWLDGNKAQ